MSDKSVDENIAGVVSCVCLKSAVQIMNEELAEEQAILGNETAEEYYV